MSGQIESSFARMVNRGKLEQCIEFLEGGMAALRRTPYHAVAGLHFLEQAPAAANFILAFYENTLETFSPSVLALVLNDFAINPSEWYFDAFAYRVDGRGVQRDWLPKHDASTSEPFVLKGMEEVQEAFANLFGDQTQSLGVRLAAEIAEHLVVAQYYQLVRNAISAARAEEPDLLLVPFECMGHDWHTDLTID